MRGRRLSRILQIDPRWKISTDNCTEQ